MGLLAYQPFRGIYLLSAVGFELARLPLWLAKYLVSYGRQHPEWSFKQALGVRLVYSMLCHVANVQLKTVLPHTPGKEKERFVTIKSPSPSLYKGPLLSNPDVKPVDIGATWYPAPLSGSSDSSSLTVVLHLHGGAYVVGDGRTESSGYFANNLLKHAGATHVLAPQYRLSSLPANETSNPFPAALQDALTSYVYLVQTLKISPKNIILSGDSAGGNLAMAFLRYLAEYGADLDIPSPSAAWLWSPWVQISEATTDEFTRTNPNYYTDYLPSSFVGWGAWAFAGTGGVSVLSSPYVSFKDKPFKTEVPIWVTAGSAEVLYFDDVKWAESMKKVGNNVTLDVVDKAPHDIVLLGNKIGFDKEATANAKRAGEWARSVRT